MCSRAKNHYDPSAQLDLSDSNTVSGTDAENQVQIFKDKFKPLNARMEKTMYFS